MTVAVSAPVLIAFLLAVVRISAWVVVAPPFNSRAVPTIVKVALALGLAFPVAPRLVGQAPAPELGPLLTAVAFQVAVGLVLGFLTQLLFAAVQAAGELVDLASGFTLASIYDPFSNVTSSMFGRLNQLVAVTLLFATNAHLLLIRGLLTSFEVLPLHAPDAGVLARLFTANLGRFFVAMLETAAPTLVVLFLADLALGLLSRAVPSMNIFSLSFPVKILLTLSLAGAAFALLPGVVNALVDRVLHETTSLSGALGG